MATPTRKKHPSVAKRQRQSVKRHLRNQAAKSQVKTFIKKAQEALAKPGLSQVEGKDETVATAQLQTVTRVLYKAASKGVLPRNTVARRVSRLAKRVHTLKIAHASSGDAQA